MQFTPFEIRQIAEAHVINFKELAEKVEAFGDTQAAEFFEECAEEYLSVVDEYDAMMQN